MKTKRTFDRMGYAPAEVGDECCMCDNGTPAWVVCSETNEGLCQRHKAGNDEARAR